MDHWFTRLLLSVLFAFLGYLGIFGVMCQLGATLCGDYRALLNPYGGVLSFLGGTSGLVLPWVLWYVFWKKPPQPPSDSESADEI